MADEQEDALRLAEAMVFASATPVTLWRVQDALQRLAALVGHLPDWTTLERFLPESLGTPM